MTRRREGEGGRRRRKKRRRRRINAGQNQSIEYCNVADNIINERQIRGTCWQNPNPLFLS